jgi:hypothetical protein
MFSYVYMFSYTYVRFVHTYLFILHHVHDSISPIHLILSVQKECVNAMKVICAFI